MSGGAFDYKQHYIGDIADEIEQTIIEAGRKIPQEVLERNYWYGRSDFDTENTYPTYERKTIEIMKRAVYVLRMAHIYAQRIDWMLSCDDGEETMAKRLEKELQELKAKYPSGRFTFNKRDVKFDEECEKYLLMNEK